MRILFVVASLTPCLASASTQGGAPGNEANDLGSGFAAIAKDLKELGQEDRDINHNISAEADTAAALNLDKLRVHDKMMHMQEEDKRLHSEFLHSQHSMEHVQQKYQRSFGFVKDKYEGEIRGMLPRLERCGKQRDQLASELNVASAELYMAQEKLENAREETNATKRNWTSLVSQLAHAVDEDEKRIINLHEDMSKNENDTRRSVLGINDMSTENQRLEQVLANASDRLVAAKEEGTHLAESIRHEQQEGVELKKKSEELGNSAKQLLKRLKDQAHVEQSSRTVSEASINASNVQAKEIQELIEAHKAQIIVAHAETDKATKQLEDANKLLAKDHDLIEVSQNRTAEVQAHVTAQCDHELAQVQLEAGQRAAALQVALDEAKHTEDKISEENRELMKQVDALKQQIAHTFVQFDA